jgi:hypothetical protein
MPTPGTPLTAPPGYVGYTATPLTSSPLKRVGALAKAAMILVGIAGACSLLTYLIGLPLVDDAEAFLRGDTSSNDFARTMAPYGVVALVQGVATLAAVVLVMIWMYRLAANLRAMHRGTRWGPGWAIGGWFLPPLLYIIPFLMFRELWKASDPDVPIGGDWRSGSVTWVLTAWFVVYGPVSIVVQAISASSGFSLGGSERDLAEQVVDAQDTAAFAGVAGVAAAALFVVMATQLTNRHKRLIGEG